MLRPRTGKQYAKCGIDQGIRNPLTLSTVKDKKIKTKIYGKVVQTSLKQIDERLKHLQLHWSKKHECWKIRNKEYVKINGEKLPDSNNMKKLRLKIQRLQRKARYIKNSWSQRVSNEIANHFETIKVEDLKRRNMIKSAKGTKKKPGKNVAAKSGLNREMLRVPLGRVISFIEYKAKLYGGQLQKVDPRNTSRKCSECGYTDKENRHSDEFICLNCRYEQDADINAAINIMRKKPIITRIKKSNYLRSKLRKAA